MMEIKQIELTDVIEIPALMSKQYTLMIANGQPYLKECYSENIYARDKEDSILFLCRAMWQEIVEMRKQMSKINGERK